MAITTRFELAAPIEAAWAYLLDVPKIAHCVPGASLTEVIDDKTYGGKVDVKLGPIGVSYKGRITIQSMDGDPTLIGDADGPQLDVDLAAVRLVVDHLGERRTRDTVRDLRNVKKIGPCRLDRSCQ